MFFLFPFLLAVPFLYAFRLRRRNISKKGVIISALGLPQNLTHQFLGFFHPYCNAGGGGERVLWTAVAAIQRAHPNLICVVYSGDMDSTKPAILANVQARFNINLDPSHLHFVFLRSRNLVEDSAWPRFTLLGQSLGSMYLAWEALSQFIPDLYIDTMGYAFTFHVVAFLARIPIGAYVHYPTISTDMLARVRSRKEWHTNAANISSSAILSHAKLLYYRLFMYYYSYSLQRAQFLMVNSTWTKNHVDAILGHSDLLLDLLHVYPLLFPSRHLSPKSARIVYPPCDTRAMSTFSLEHRERVILSVAQFRPEKDHATQLRSFQKLLLKHQEYASSDPRGIKLVLIGGSRNEGDAERVNSLRKLAQELEIHERVEFIINASYPVVLDWLRRSSIGFSTMVDEHFGINVVEFMPLWQAAGVIPVAHASGGPLQDIVVPLEGKPTGICIIQSVCCQRLNTVFMTGFHAKDDEGFAEVLHQALSLSQEDDLALRATARKLAVNRFSEEEFVRGWNASGWLTFLAAAS
ncbi:glycosyltransferase family 4 protein [Amanita thiersii Skay4041]|uniref:GDP-Man:Man(3)GlcNAc(2)-PP-Dol alpha-1,2-mannosyltransferase n=1 Tax=Amanita thiersii Skay4041 TaxID=703135 RepID=A0A2A9NV84_9AGAR|nr:glycosyltransferase family 4 protein [Amanita thiersii Skay4041]